MATLTAEKATLSCPRCQRKYEDGNQRFCNSDGVRLQPVVNAGLKNQNQTEGIFTNLLSKTAKRSENDERIPNAPRAVKVENRQPSIQSTAKSPLFKAENRPSSLNNKIPLPKKVKPNRTKNATTNSNASHNNNQSPNATFKLDQNNASVIRDRDNYNRKPQGNTPLTAKKADPLVGKTLKGRYRLLTKLNSDESSVLYQAQDQIIQGKKVLVRIVDDNVATDGFQKKMVADQRIALSQINHPNIAKLIDTGRLPKGKYFIINEYLENVTVKGFTNKTGVFNPMRAARIVRQSAMALNEVHQNGILHRNLLPQHILLTVSESGNETVKVSDFCLSDGTITAANYLYKAPEQLNGQMPTFASDSYSLAVIAYQMLTNRLPFQGKNVKELLDSQKAGLKVEVSNLNPNLNPFVDKILSKGLSYNPIDRYPNSRDFGEAFFNALTTSSHWDESTDAKNNSKVGKDSIALPTLPIGVSSETKQSNQSNLKTGLPNQNKKDITHYDSKGRLGDSGEVLVSDVEFEKEFTSESGRTKAGGVLWKKRSPEPTREGNSLFTILSIVGTIILFVGAFATWSYFNNMEETAPQVVEKTSPPNEVSPTISAVVETTESSASKNTIDVPPPQRDIIPPKDFEYFENSKSKLEGSLAKNYRGFSMYYPKTWTKSDSKTNYVDVKLVEDGYPKQQFLVTRYESRGTFKLDDSIFQTLVAKSDKVLKNYMRNYKIVSQGEITVNNGWKAYEVTFKGIVPKDNKNVETWGRRIWMPAGRPGVNNGFVITMLATSLSDKIESLDDVGKTGELGEILRTFEPEQGY